MRYVHSSVPWAESCVGVSVELFYSIIITQCMFSNMKRSIVMKVGEGLE